MTAPTTGTYRERRERGDCVDCDVNRPLDGAARCVACSERRAARRAELRAARAKAGRCTECAKPARKGETLCARHARENAARALASYRRRVD